MGEVKDVMLQLVKEMRDIIKRIYAPMAEADVKVILHSIPDPTCTAL